MFSKFIAMFNDNRANLIAASVIKLLDESMSAWRPRKDKTGGLPNISFILQKPEPGDGVYEHGMLCYRYMVNRVFYLSYFLLY